MIQDDEEVSALKERIIDMQESQHRKDSQAQTIIHQKDIHISQLEDRIDEMQRQMDALREE